MKITPSVNKFPIIIDTKCNRLFKVSPPNYSLHTLKNENILQLSHNSELYPTLFHFPILFDKTKK